MFMLAVFSRKKSNHLFFFFKIHKPSEIAVFLRRKTGHKSGNGSGGCGGKNSGERGEEMFLEDVCFVLFLNVIISQTINYT